jgi:hypothetical protein
MISDFGRVGVKLLSEMVQFFNGLLRMFFISLSKISGLLLTFVVKLKKYDKNSLW